MKCDQITPYISGYATGDLRADTMSIVARHIDTCARCGSEVAVHRRVAGGLATLSERELEPPPFLLDAILESVSERRIRRVFPILPVPLSDAARIVSDNREVIASAAGTVLVAATAAYALWRALKAARPAGEPATS